MEREWKEGGGQWRRLGTHKDLNRGLANVVLHHMHSLGPRVVEQPLHQSHYCGTTVVADEVTLQDALNAADLVPQERTGLIEILDVCFVTSWIDAIEFAKRVRRRGKGKRSCRKLIPCLSEGEYTGVVGVLGCWVVWTEG